MTKTKRISRIFAVALAIVLTMALAVPAFASSQDVAINRFTVTSSNQYITPQLKENGTSCYVKLNNLDTHSSAMINVYGQSAPPWGNSGKKICNYGGNDRIINVGTGYLVRNTVYESNWSHATLAFSRSITTNYDIAGYWSPDSVYQSGLITI
ncbi:MAG: DUF2712 domain-containing protein [Oscillospiraceae bacterium]